MAKNQDKSIGEESFANCGPVPEEGDVLVYSHFAGYRVTQHSEYVGFNRVDGRHELVPHRLRVPPGLSYQPRGLWGIATKRGEKGEAVGSFSEYLIDGDMVELVDDLAGVREKKALEMIAESGDEKTLQRIAEGETREEVVRFIREQVDSLRKTGDASAHARKLQRAHNRRAG